MRSAPRRLLELDDVFPPSMVPVLAAGGPADSWSPAVRRHIAVQHLYRYLNFTTHLETHVVNPVLLGMFTGSIGLPLTAAARRDALRMYTDEGHHSLVAFDVKLQVEELTGLEDRTIGMPRSTLVRGLHAILDASERHDLVSLFRLMFVIVSETLISTNLRDVASTPGLNGGVADALGDHARDEGRHHAFFATYLKELWGCLDADQRRQVGRQVPAMIDTFFGPEIDDVRDELQRLGVPGSEAAEALDRAYATDVVHADRVAATSLLVRYLADLDVFEDAGTHDAFLASGLAARRGEAAR
ncbi:MULTISPECIES: diiron oxygenase [unclassified Clavibacter]|uniref:diiron oxygenase n=1 Tax=unclassified Clavibacter TaxID=2626594 RepID=UPI0022EB8ED2|nr:diiron oxygenase [Clavibacter sp. CT19]MDA3804934.1 diiron oxygenase [Clavibacter sp. CT19]